MRRLNICGERGSGVDRAIEVIEEFQLPAPEFIRGDEYTRVILYAPLPLTQMNRKAGLEPVINILVCIFAHLNVSHLHQ